MTTQQILSNLNLTEKNTLASFISRGVKGRNFCVDDLPKSLIAKLGRELIRSLVIDFNSKDKKKQENYYRLFASNAEKFIDNL